VTPGSIRHTSLYQRFIPTGASARALVWRYSPDFRRPRHFHDEPELNLIVSGSATFGIGDTVVTANQGQILGFPAGQDHELIQASADLQLYAIGMDASFSTQVLGADRHSVTTPFHISVASRNLEALLARCAAIVDRRAVDQPAAEVWEQINWLRQRQLGSASGGMHVLTRRALSTISDAPELDRELLARRMRASPSEVSRYFHRDVGMTLGRYRTRLRLLRFIRLADALPRNLRAAAEGAGFGSYSQCHRAFQAELGCAPRRFFASGVRQRMESTYVPKPIPSRATRGA
jgi:AraC-like DNA-binding protein/mannose-6-phosphate isomerase-like protein (cupin superfamily)